MLGTALVKGIATAGFTYFLAAIAYDSAVEIQAASTVRGIDLFFKAGPIVIYAICLVTLLFYKLDEEYPMIIKELQERKAEEKQ